MESSLHVERNIDFSYTAEEVTKKATISVYTVSKWINLISKAVTIPLW